MHVRIRFSLAVAAALIALPTLTVAAQLPKAVDVAFYNKFATLVITLDKLPSALIHLHYKVHKNGDAVYEGSLAHRPDYGIKAVIGGFYEYFQQHGSDRAVFTVEIRVCDGTAGKYVLSSKCSSEVFRKDVIYSTVRQEVMIENIAFRSLFDTAIVTLSAVPEEDINIQYEVQRVTDGQVVKRGGLPVQAGSAVTEQINGFKEIFAQSGGRSSFKVRFAVCPYNTGIRGSGIDQTCGAAKSISVRYRARAETKRR